jgi:Tfp pilus assembly protein PilX
MNKYHRHRLPRVSRERSQGVALAVALVFLLVLTLLGVSSLSGNTAQERMTYAFGDTIRAFHAADAAVREGEYWVSQQPRNVFPGMGTNVPMFAATGTNMTQSTFNNTNMMDSSWWAANGMSFGSFYSLTASPAARGTNMVELNRGSVNNTWYVVESMGPNPYFKSMNPGSQPSFTDYYYRITGHSTNAGQGTSSVTVNVQSVWAWPQQ